MVKVFREDRDKRNRRTRAWHKDNPERSLFITARSRAKQQDIPFEIEIEDITIPEICPVFGIPLRISQGKRTDNSPSLDKRVIEKGYVRGNIAIISWRANRLKCDANLEELKQLVAYMENEDSRLSN